MQMFRILVLPVINVEEVLPQHRVQVLLREYILVRSPTAVVCAMFRILVVPVINVEEVLLQCRVQVLPREFILVRSPTAVICAVRDSSLLAIRSSTWKPM